MSQAIIPAGCRLRGRTLTNAVCLPVIACGLLTAGCFEEQQPTTTDSAISIGLLASVSGDGQAIGQGIKAGAERAAGDINTLLVASGAESSVRLITGDTAGDPATALAKLEALHNLGVRLVVGPDSPAQMAAVRTFAQENGIVLLLPTDTSTLLTAAGDGIYALGQANAHEAAATAALLWDDGMRSVVTLSRNDELAVDSAADVVARIDALGGTSPQGVTYDASTTDFTATVQALSAAVAGATVGPAATAVYVAASDEIVAILDLAQNDATLAGVRWYASHSVAQSEALRISPTAAVFANQVSLTCAQYADEEETSADETLLGELATTLGATPDRSAAVAYDAVWLGVWSYLLAGVPEPSTGVLSSTLERTAATYFGVTGLTTFDDLGDRAYYDYDFWMLQPADTTGYLWQTAARYQVDPGAEPQIIRSAE